MTGDEGEIILTERYGSSGHEIIYVKPPGQSKVVVVERRGNGWGLIRWLTAVFLPQGYPESVSPDYTQYQLWDTAQAFCSTITGTLATQEVLRGVGVGDTSASPAAATITWVLKDGCGHLGRIFFAASHGTSLDAYSKKWRLYADCLNDAAICMEMALPFFTGYTTLLLCLTTTMKAIVGVAGGATRAALTQHHAVRFNMADVSAKDSAQETAVNLVASVVALMIITIAGKSLLIFATMVVLHIVFNYFAVRSVCLRTFNEPRFLLAIDQYMKRENVPAPFDINRLEPIIFHQIGKSLMDMQVCGFNIEMGLSLRSLVTDERGGSGGAAATRRAASAFAGLRRYALCPNERRRRMRVVLARSATTDDILCAYFHAVVLSQVLSGAGRCTRLSETHDNLSPFQRICHTVQSGERLLSDSIDEMNNVFEDQDLSKNLEQELTPGLIRLMDIAAQKEWKKFKSALQYTGWNLEKHLLMVDEWRVDTNEPLA